MLNARFDRLNDYPFQRLRALLDGLMPPADRPVINLSIGEPRHPQPAFAADIIARESAGYGVYPPNEGPLYLRQAAAEWLARRYDLPQGMVDPARHILALNGTREGLFMIAQAVTPEAKANRKPLVLMPNPFYQCYAGAALAAGAEFKLLPAGRAQNFLPDLDAISDEDWSRASLIYLCTPGNPQGQAASLDYMTRLIKRARDHDVVVAFDECYAEIYTRTAPTGAMEACKALGGDMKNVIAFHSLSKRSNMPGLRSGFCGGDASLIAAFLKVRSYGGAPLALPVAAASAALWREESHVEANRDLYRTKYDMAEARLAGRLGFYRPDGGFYLWLDVDDGERAAKELWSAAGLRTLPGLYLTRQDGPGWEENRRYLRIALVADLKETEAALDAICRVLG